GADNSGRAIGDRWIRRPGARLHAVSGHAGSRRWILAGYRHSDGQCRPLRAAMLMNVNFIIDACRNTERAAKDALSWIGNEKNAAKILLEKPMLERALRRTAFEARKLEQGANRPMCLGVFGPSQSGKSYLVSVLARKGTTLTACFDDANRPEIDF